MFLCLENDYSLAYTLYMSRGWKEVQPGMLESTEGKITPFPVRTHRVQPIPIYGYIYKRQLGTKAAQYRIK